jgi:DNA polymerase III sliding clamp (beta) subunit (PCNA family)
VSILDSLRFVRGALAKKDIVAALTHFRIKDGRVTGYNGKMALSSPIPIDLDCTPKGSAFATAIAACEATVQLSLTPTGRLSVRSGKFRSLIECSEEVFPEIGPEGIQVELTPESPLLPALRSLYPLTAEDASRPWAAGVLFNGVTAFASNNIVLAQYWLGFRFPYKICVPRYAVAELLRINEEPVRLWVSQTSITFEFSNSRWLRTQLNDNDWPPAEELLDKLPGNAPPIPAGMFSAVDKLERIYFREGEIATHPDGTEGSAVDFDDLPPVGIYSASMLLLLEGMADTIHFDAYPRPCVWYGKGVRGCLIGLRN